MPDTVAEDLEDDVRELMAAKASAASCDASAMLAALQLTPDAVPAKFTLATHFVAVVLSRLQRDPSSLEMRLWELETHANRLWALRQQASVGSCEASRGSKAYASVVAADDAGDDARRSAPRGLVHWVPCCVSLRGESKLKLWQALGDMSPLDAQLRYIHIVTELAPEWSDPLSTDSALLRTWTPDDESDRCAVCDEAFTFLNRRHHCRRCSNLVCAVCSPHSMPLRVFSQTSKTPQRICQPCYHEISHQTVPADSSAAVRLGGVSIRDPKAHVAVRRPPEVTLSYSFSTEDDEPEGPAESAAAPAPSLVELAASSSSTTSTPAYKQSLSSISPTIHCGHLEFLHGAGFRKNWNAYFFVLLIRKGSLGMFLTETDHVEKKKRPAAVFKLSGYTIRIKSQKRRPHQFRLSHATKKPLHFAATSIEDMNLWISQLIKAVDNANDLETRPAVVASPRGVEAAVTTVVEDEAQV